MSELTKSDQELLKLRAAKMSTKSIAMLMGGRWTVAGVDKRLAQIDDQVAALSPELPRLHRIDEDLPEEPLPLVDLDDDEARLAEVAALCRRTARFPASDHQVLLISNPDVPTPASWLVAGVDYGSGHLETTFVIQAGSASNKSFELVSWREPAPIPQELPDARETADQPPAVADAAPDAEPVVAPAETSAVHAGAAQADGGQAPKAPVPEEALSPAPNPLAVEARPFVPVHQVRARKAAPAVARPAPNLLAAPPSPPSRPSSRGGATRLKPLTERVARWAGQFMWAGWDLFEIAELFDVSPEALEKVLT